MTSLSVLRRRALLIRTLHLLAPHTFPHPAREGFVLLHLSPLLTDLVQRRCHHDMSAGLASTWYPLSELPNMRRYGLTQYDCNARVCAHAKNVQERSMKKD